MPTANLHNTAETIDTSRDNIIIVENKRSLRGGRTLDVTGFAPLFIRAGHLIIRQTANGNLKPMPVTGANYDALPAGHTYEGALVATILTAKPFAGVMYDGTVNPLPCEYVPSAAVQTAVQTAIPTLFFKSE